MPRQYSELMAKYDVVRACMDKLTPALLAKTFRGELVPQDSNDELAEGLLERIRGIRKKAEKSKRQNRVVG